MVFPIAATTGYDSPRESHRMEENPPNRPLHPTPCDTPTSPAEQDRSAQLRRALVVDDHDDSAEALGMMLRMLGYEAQTADNGMDALRKVSDFRPDLILLDISMPKLDGYDTCQVIRDQPWGKDVRLVAVTGKEPDEVQKRSEEVGFDAYLIKPVELDALRAIVADSMPMQE